MFYKDPIQTLLTTLTDENCHTHVGTVMVEHLCVFKCSIAGEERSASQLYRVEAYGVGEGGGKG